ncbi:MAG: cell division protein FtsL [Lachnospiraceae bacterium]|nr:cell division protein FtsL [Lachnospiraceae bacterium]
MSNNNYLSRTYNRTYNRGDYRVKITTGRNSYYVEGNAVRENAPDYERGPQIKKINPAAKRNREKAKRMDLGYILFLTIAVCITAITLLGYIKLQSELTVSSKRVASLERELNNLRLSNDESLARINASVNLEEIKQVAVEELGMTYAKEGQVVIVSSEGSDYVRQIRELK